MVQSQWGVRVDSFAFGSTSDFASFLLSPPFMDSQYLSQKEDFLLYGAILCDTIWKQRNQSLFGDNTLSIDGVSTKIYSLVSEHKISKATTPRQQVPSFTQIWIPPPSLSFKINVYATMVVKDRRGELVFANSMKVNTTLPLQAEVEAIKWALSLAPTMGNKFIIVESNSQSCVQILNDLVDTPLPPQKLEDQVLVL